MIQIMRMPGTKTSLAFSLFFLSLSSFLGSVLSFSSRLAFFRLDRKFTEEIFEFIGLIDLKTHVYHLTLTCLPQG